MLKTVLKLFNENHWYLIAGTLLAATILWGYGCESKVGSMVKDGTMVTRGELQAEAEYLMSMLRSKAENLDRQDEIKQALLDSANVMSKTGSINPSGLLNLAASIGGISFGLTQRQKLKTASSKKTTDTT